MTMLVEEIAQDAKWLPRQQRAQLAHLLIVSLDDESDEGVEDLWATEVDRRSEDIRTGRVTCRPIVDVVADIRVKLRHARTQSS